jgi:methanogenic corrinoid protein MtbC1
MNKETSWAIPSASSIDEYAQQLDVLVNDVNERFARSPDASTLIGGNPLERAWSNHRHHAQLMHTVFRLDAKGILEGTIPWVYRVYRSHGFASEYFPFEFEAWRDSIRKRLSVEAANELGAIYDWLLDRHDEHWSLAQQPPPSVTVGNERWGEMREQLLQLLLAGETRACLELVDQATLDITHVNELFHEVMQPVLYEVGRRWETRRISVAQEHLASAVVGRLLAQLYRSFPSTEATRGVAVVTAAPNEFHEIGPRMVADLLELDGWETDFVGANTPTEELLGLLVERKPRMLLVSVTIAFNLEKVAQMIEMIRSTPSLDSLKVMVGGQALALDDELWRRLGADGSADSANSALELARQWFPLD